jgi:hypothetical protein
MTETESAFRDGGRWLHNAEHKTANSVLSSLLDLLKNGNVGCKLVETPSIFETVCDSVSQRLKHRASISVNTKP